MVKGAPGNLQKEKIINKRKHAGRRPIGIKYFEARMVYRLHYVNISQTFINKKYAYIIGDRKLGLHKFLNIYMCNTI